MLTDPAAHGIDLKRTAVLYTATGSEWPETRLLCEEFMLPLLRSHGVRFVQLARAGHLKADGITVLDDSRHPEQLFARGLWTLWDELESVGTVPQQAGVRKCSLLCTKSRQANREGGGRADEGGRPTERTASPAGRGGPELRIRHPRDPAPGPTGPRTGSWTR
ncbi:hypothetical protein ACIBW9_36685 [Streptomyces sp. NPDC049541]|uniref:hypothetical protein n=1 Tax=Streptomyces sp. NPDC049541 TaxID=3365594 RepID=UPI00379EB309